MSAALFNRYVDPARACAISAGTQPAERVHPVVVEVMREVGIDLSFAKLLEHVPLAIENAEPSEPF